jgi:uncharacterized protein (UPF0297 family)
VRRPELYPDGPVNCKWYDRPEVYLKAFLMDACTIPDELLKKIWEAMEAQLKRENSLTEQDSGRSWMDFSKNQVTVPTLFAKMSNAAYDFGYWTVYIRKLYTCSRMVFDLYLGHWWSMEDNTIPAEELWVKAWAPVQEAVVECCKDDPWYLKRMFMSFLRFPVFQRYHENLSGALKMENMNSLARCGALFSQSEEGRQRFLEYVLRQCPHDPDIRPAYRSMMEDLKWDLYEILVSSRSACWGQGVWTYIKNAAWLWGDNVTLRFTVDANKMWQFKEIIQELFLYHENEGSLEYIKSVTYTVCDDDPARNALENVCREEMRQYVLDELCRKNRKEMIVTAYQKGFFGKEQLEKWFINKRRRKCIKDVLPELKALLKDENTPYCEGAGE